MGFAHCLEHRSRELLEPRRDPHQDPEQETQRPSQDEPCRESHQGFGQMLTELSGHRELVQRGGYLARRYQHLLRNQVKAGERRPISTEARPAR